jgi:BMFP domain-containing protein YqiC
MDDSVSLREYVEARFVSVLALISANKELVGARFEQNQIAIDKAEQAQQLRNEAQNEWRNQLRDERANFATRNDQDALEKRLEVLESRVNTSEGAKSGQIDMRAWIVAAVAVLAALAAWVRPVIH